MRLCLCSPTYNVSFTSIGVGSESVAAEFAAVMDSGTSFTYLSDPEYTQLATKVSRFASSLIEGMCVFGFPFLEFLMCLLPCFHYCVQFNSQVSERRVNFSSGSADPFPFEYCYRLRYKQTSKQILLCVIVSFIITSDVRGCCELQAALTRQRWRCRT